MNPPDPPAAALGAIRARHFDQYGMCGSGLCGQFWPCDAARLYDAQAARLAAAEAERDKAIVDAAMARTDLQRIADRLMREDEECAAKTARLVALEQAAREIAVLWPSDPKLWAWEEVEVLVAAVKALAAPPGEGA